MNHTTYHTDLLTNQFVTKSRYITKKSRKMMDSDSKNRNKKLTPKQFALSS